MQRVFLFFSFNERVRDLASLVERLFASHDIRVIKGSNLGGGRLQDEVFKRIDASEGLVALFTRRDRLQEERWTIHDWVKDKHGHARQDHKRVVAFHDSNIFKVVSPSDFEALASDLINKK